MKNGDILREMNQLLRVGKTRGGRQPKRPPPEYDRLSFLTPQTCRNPDKFPPLHRNVF